MIKKFLKGSVLVSALVAGPALAADLPMKAAMMSPVPVYSWTGFYVGGFVGAGWGTSEVTLNSITNPLINGGLPVIVNLPFTQVTSNGFLGGGQIGYNWQSGGFVFGVEGDFAGAGIKGTAPCLAVFSCSSKTNWLATVSGRVGGVVLDKILVYAKGGYAWKNTDYSATDTAGILFAPGATTSATSTRGGWLLGMGAEYAFARNWTGFVEYNYMDFGSKSVGFVYPAGAFGGAPAGTASASITDTLHVMKTGVNYKFSY